MKSSKKLFAVAVVFAAACVFIGTGRTTHAAPVVFTYNGAVTGVTGASMAGLVSIGDALQIDVLTDNGSSSLISQTWDVLDTISATVTAGSYSATFTNDWFTSVSATGFATDGVGVLTQTNWFGTNVSPSATDNFGSNVHLMNLTLRASNGDRLDYAPLLETVAAWTDPRIVPEPSSMIVACGVLLGLFGATIESRRRLG